MRIATRPSSASISSRLHSSSGHADNGGSNKMVQRNTQQARLESGSTITAFVIEWPAWSPDLNPIEELWNDLKQRVYGRRPKSMDELELERCIAEEWTATDLNFIARIC